MKKYLLSALLAVACIETGVLKAADVAGKWEVTMNYGGQDVKSTLEFTRGLNRTFSGKWIGRHRTSELDNIQYNSPFLSFQRTIKWAETEGTMTFTGQVSDNKLTGKIKSDWGQTDLNGIRLNENSQSVIKEQAPPDLTIDDLLRKLRQNQSITDKEINEVVTSLLKKEQTLSPENTLPKLYLLRGSKEPIIPTAEKPIKKEQGLEWVILTLENQQIMNRLPEETTGHPSADVFPGAVAENAKRVTRDVTFNTSLPGWHNHGVYSESTKAYWHSTGLYAAPGEMINVKLPEDMINKGFALRIGAHNDVLWQVPIWMRMPEIYRLFTVCTSEMNIANAFGGLIYIEVPYDLEIGELTVTISGAVEAPHFVLGKTSIEKWQKTIRNNPAPWAELETDKIVLTIPSSDIRKMDNPEELMIFWNGIMDKYAQLQGITPDRRRAERFVSDVQIALGYMHSGYPLMTWLDITSTMVDIERIKANGHNGVWGLYHELGHNHQKVEWTFGGTTEVTNNLFSLYLMEEIGNIKPNDIESINDQTRAGWVKKYFQDGAKFQSWQAQPFLALCMYIQMQEEFGWEAFTNTFGEYPMLPDNLKPKTDNDRRDQWMRRFSRNAGKNLGPFFQAWGVPTSQEARDSISDLQAWMPENFPPTIDTPKENAKLKTTEEDKKL